MITDHLMLDVLRSTTTAHGALCVMMALTTATHKSHALCSDLGDLLLVVTLYIMNSTFSYQRAIGRLVTWSVPAGPLLNYVTWAININSVVRTLP